ATDCPLQGIIASPNTGRSLAAVPLAWSPELEGGTAGGGFIVGVFSWVMTASTPAACWAAAVPMLRIRPLAMVLVTTAACARSFGLNSAEKRAWPRSEERRVGK